MRCLSFCVSVLLIISAPALSAETLNNKEDPIRVTGTYWSSQMRQRLPEALCHPNADFMACHIVTSDVCLAEVKDWLPRCLPAKIPETLLTSPDGENLAAETGLCIGKKFEERHAQRKATAECKQRKGAA